MMKVFIFVVFFAGLAACQPFQDEQEVEFEIPYEMEDAGEESLALDMSDPRFSSSRSCSSTSSRISRVFVYRRPLAPLKYLAKYGPLAHSGLILRLSNGLECVLEYMGDGKAHLYNAKYSIIGNKWIAGLRKVYKLRFTDYLGDTYSTGVTRQYHGASVPSRGRVTPRQAKSLMERAMGSNYDLFRNNCHLGQERTRRALGLTVSHPYIFPYNKDQLCRLINARTQGKILFQYLHNPYAVLLIKYCHITRG